MRGRITAKVYGMQMAMAGLRFGGFVLAARLFGIDAVGTVAFSLALAGLFSVLHTAGLDAAHVRLVHELPERQARGAFMLWRSAAVILYLAAAQAIVWWYVRDGRVAWVAHVIVFWEGMRAFAWAVASDRQAGQRFLTAMALQAVDTLVRVAVLVAMGAWIWVVAPAANGAVWFAIAYLIGGAGALAVAMASMARTPVETPPRAQLQRYLKWAVPAAALHAIALLQTNIDTVMIDRWRTTGEVAAYYAAQRFILPLMMLHAAIWTVLYPRMSQLASRDEWAHGSILLAETARRALFLVGAAAVAAMWLGPFIVPWMLGPEYLASVQVLVILAFAALFATRVLFHSIEAHARQVVGIVAASSVFGILINISLNVVAIPDSLGGIRLLGLGARGAALASAAAFMAMGAVLDMRLHRHSGVRLHGSMLHVAALTLLPIAVMAWTAWRFDSVLVDVLIGGVLTVAFVAACMATGLIGLADLQWMRQFLPRRRQS